MNRTRSVDKRLNANRSPFKRLPTELETRELVAFAATLFQENVTTHTLLTSLSEGVVACDAYGRIIFLNPRAEEMFRCTLDDVVGHSLSIFLPDQIRETHHHHVNKFLQMPDSRPMGQGWELIGKRMTGEEFPVSISLSYLPTEAGVLGLAMVSDITARKEMEQVLRLRTAELDTFTHKVTHDLQGTLRTLIGFSEVLVETHTELADAEREKYLQALAWNGRQIGNIVNELLVISSLRQEEIAPEPLPMRKLVDQAMHRLKHMITGRDAQIHVADPLHNALGQSHWVEEVWFNYLANAIKYGGATPVVEINSRLAGPWIQYRVKDNGRGLTAEEQQQLYREFNRPPDVRFQGHGLGLPVVGRIVQKLGGKIEVESQKGGGSTFSFFLPRVP